MRKLSFISGVLGLAALGLTACSNELPVQEPQKAEADETRFISIQISAPSDVATRAFENGTGNESYVNRLDFFFYDAAGNPTSTPVPMTLDDIQKKVEAGEAYFGNGLNNNVTRVYTTVVAAALTQGQNLPSQVICIVNGESDAINALKKVTLANLIDQLRTTFRTDSYFTMSNSVYYGQNILTGQANQRLCATPINPNTQLFPTKDKALKAVEDSKDEDISNDGALVDIYVERLAAKVGLTMGTGETVLVPYELQDASKNDVTLTFVPEYWTMNATDQQVYLTKRYGVETTPAEYDESGELVTPAVINRTPNWSQIANALTGSETNSWWNDPDNFRSYWGTSPSYFADSYPDVSDDVNDLVNYSHDYKINYRSYTNIAGQAARTDAGIAGIGKQALAWNATNGFSTGSTNVTLGETSTQASTGYIYTFETTASRYRINDIAKSNPAAVVASAVVVGKYQVNGAPVTEAFYIDRNAGTNGIYYPDAAAVKNVLAGRQRIVFSRTGAGSEEDPYRYTALPATDTRLTVKHPDKDARDAAGIKLAGRLVTLQLQEITGNPIYYFDYDEEGNGEYVPVNAGNLADVNAQLFAVGYMDMFAQGLGFYSVPIRHLNFDLNNAGNALYDPATNIYDWANMPSGAFGVVRNHVYNLTISKISGLATALRSPDQPIVPAKEETNQYIAARLNILAWNVVNAWSVNL